jgi:integrase
MIAEHSNAEFQAKSLGVLTSVMTHVWKLNDKKDLPFKNLMIVGLSLGLRYSDINELTYGDIIQMNESEKFIIQRKFRDKKIKKIKLFPHTEMLKHFNNVYENTFNIKESTPILAKFGTQEAYSYNTMNRFVKKFSVDIGIAANTSANHISTHSLRKTFARNFYDLGNRTDNTLLALSMYFNHDSITTTRIYIGLVDEEITNILSKMYL